jgi:hypothetical protein
VRKENEINLGSDAAIMMIRVGETFQVETRMSGIRGAFKSQAYRKRAKFGLGELYFMAGSYKIRVSQVRRLVRLEQVF